MSNLLRIGSLPLLLINFASGPLAAQEARLRPTDAIYLDEFGGRIESPQGVAFDGNEMLAVADTGNRRLLLFDLKGDAITPRSEIRVPQLPYPVHVRIDSRGEILVLDGRKRQIGRVDPDGEFKGYLELGSPEGKDGVIPRSFELDAGDNLYLLDVAGGRILVLGPQGNALREIEFPPDVGFLSDLTVNPGGTVFAVDSVGRRIFVARKDDSVLVPLTDPLEEELSFPTSIAADSQGQLFVADEQDGGILVLGQNGSLGSRQSRMGWKEGFLRYPAGLSAVDDSLFVADRANNRVQRFAIVR